MIPLYPVFLSVSAAERAVAPAPIMTICLDLSTFSAPISAGAGAASHPLLGTYT